MWNAIRDDASATFNSPTPIGFGGTGANSASAARTALGVVPQTSASDATAGRLLTPGAFGLGGAAITVSNFDTIVVSGLYTNGTNTSATGVPTADIHWHVLDIRNGAGTAVQIALNVGSGLMRYRRQVSGAWSTWRPVYNAQSTVGTVSQAGGIPSGPIIERGSNSNGHYTRWTDGTQICWKTDLTLSYNSASQLSATWTLPAAFADADEVAADLQIRSSSDFTGATVADIGCTRASPSTTAVAYVISRVAGGTNFPVGSSIVNCRAKAIGRWF